MSDRTTQTESQFKVTIARTGYSVLLGLLVLLILPWSLFRSILGGPEVRQRWLARIGIERARNQYGGLLIHCVSVGEVMAAAPLIRKILAEQPHLPITVTTTTLTGRQRARELFAGQVCQRYLPIDLPWLMSRLLHQIKPSKVLVVEVELWPNLLHLCRRQSIPVIIVNARMTDRSARRYARFGSLFVSMLQRLHLVCAQGQRDYENYLNLGVPRQRLVLTGNMKFDLAVQDKMVLKAQLVEKFALQQRRVLLGGSTHDGEEKILIQVYQILKKQFPELILILVPRHPQRFEPVWNLCTAVSQACIRVSEEKRCDAATDILLIDRMGMLQQCYALADIAFVGGSLADRGGHNALEASALAVPVLMGPSQFNNPEICQTLQQAGALITVHDQQDLLIQCQQWLAHTERAEQAGQAGKAVLEENRGAVLRTYALLQ